MSRGSRTTFFEKKCKNVTLAMPKGSQTTIFEKKVWERDLSHAERVTNHFLERKCKKVTLAMSRGSQTTFWKNAWDFENACIHEILENAYMKIFESAWMREIFEFTYIDAWNYLRKCTYECVKILNLHILMHEVLFFCYESAWMNAWVHETYTLFYFLSC